MEMWKNELIIILLNIDKTMIANKQNKKLTKIR